jgi:PAS domain S-box-containing protein
MDQTTPATAELRRLVRDLVGLSALPAVWVGFGPLQIVESLADVLLRTLHLDLVYLRLKGQGGRPPFEVARTAHAPPSPARTREIGQALEGCLDGDSSGPAALVANPLGSGMLQVAVVPLGHGGQSGFLVAGSRRTDFPTETERLLLNVGTNQGASLIREKQDDEVILSQREQLRVTLTSIGDGVIVTDTEGRVRSLNPVAESLTGWPQKEAIGQPLEVVFCIINETTGQAVQNPVARVLREGAVVGLANHTVLIARDGSERPIDDSAAPIRDAGGNITGVVLVFHDVTAARQAERALREREEQFRTLADSIPQLAWMTRPDGHIFWYNRRWYDYTGTTFEQMQGWGWQSVHDPRELPRVLQNWKAALASGEPWEDNFPLRRHDGQMRWHLSRAIPVRDEQGRVVRWFGTNTDVQDRREAEARLGQYAERQRLLWEAAAVLLTTNEPDAMLRGLFARIAPHFSLDAYFNFLLTESGDALRLASCVGIPSEEARKISRLELGQAICGTVARERRPIDATFIQQSDDPKVQLVKSQGIRCYACSPLLVGDRLLGTLSFASRSRDSFEEEELEFLRTICHYVTVAYERLRLVHELREADRRKDEFLATLAHELRNPLAPIRNSLHVLRLTGNNPALLEQARSMMERQLGQMVRLVDDLLDVSRISRGKLELRKERVNLATVVQNAVEMARPLIEASNHELTVSLPGEPVLLDADLTRLSQVISNLLNNAARYTNRGGRIWLTAQQQDGAAVVRVLDTGIGIPADQLPHIFEMFVQVDRSLERSQGGLGIGLTLVRRLVEMHGGRVEARSDGPGKGSEFVLHIPVVRAPARGPGPFDGNEPAAPIARKRILVVDDNKDSAESLGLMLQVMGHEVATAHDGLAGVERAGTFRPDVILLDIGMPRLNGHEAACRIRQQEWGKNVFLIALTGWGQEEDRRRTKEAGFDEHLVKPVDPRDLLKLLAERQIS